ncbi:mechanosensitive ion channel family protein [Kaarinaea lacus]
MDKYTNWTAALNGTFNLMMERLAQHLPNILGAILLLLVGWLLAKTLRILAIRFTRFIDKLVLNYSSKKGIKRTRLPIVSGKVIGGVIYWTVLLVFITTATNVLDLKIFTDWLSRVIGYLPTLLAGGLIILAGVLVSSIARDLVVAALPHANKEQRMLFGRIIYAVIMFTAVVIGVDQIGINVNFLIILLSIVIGTFMTGLAIAVGLGSRTVVHNMISARQFKQQYRVGDQVKVWDYTGKILELTATTIILDTTDGIVTVPAKVYSDNPILKVQETVDDE